MLGFDPFGQSAFSEVPPSAVTVTAGQIVGAAIVAGGMRHIGIYSAAGTIVGAAIVTGQSFPGLGSSLETRNQLFDFTVDVDQALIWQYDTAVNLTALVEAKQAWYNQNQTQFWEDWFTDVFNIPTANDFGCAVWSIILGIPLNIQYGETDGANWGFGPYQQNFDRGNFAPLTYEIIPLTVEQKRLVLQLRYYQLITRGCVPDINENMARIFAPFGPVWCIDNLDMTMTYIFGFKIPSVLAFILKFYSLLPAPAGVKVSFFQNGQSVGTIVGAASMIGRNGHSAGTITGAATVQGAGTTE